MYCATATSPHARHSAPGAVPCRHGRHASAHPSPDAHHQQCVTLAFVVPHAAFVAFPRCATVLTSAPPSPLDACACRALQYLLQHVGRPQRASRSFFIAGAVFVAFSYATTDAPGWAHPHRRRRPQHLRQPLSTEHAAFVASPRVLIIFSAAPTLRSEPAPGTHHEHDVHAMHVAYPCAATVFSDAPLSAQSEVLSRSASMMRTCGAHAAAFPHHPRHFRPVLARTHHLEAGAAHSPSSALRPSHPNTAPILSAVPLPDTRASCHYDMPAKRAPAHGDDAQPPLEQQLRCA
ncbi:hypothetical protein B0H19DRAFT_1274725 [Mycena capillaripes]|nr:hypothetical protein B0H19DRAFT_1274725 [Mycena capillaripes]